MDVLRLSDIVTNAQASTQHDLQTSAQRLASGLRINSAADDPSGLAISTSLAARAAGYDQAARNVQDASNALTVADASLQSVTELLQRVRTLIVQSNSSINSDQQLQSIQAEIHQILLEVNQIAQRTEFNGRKLLDGSLDNSLPQQASFQEVTAPGNLYDGGLASDQVVNADGLGNAGQLLQQVNPGSTVISAPIYTIATVVQYDPNNVNDPIFGPIGPGVIIETKTYSTDPNFGPAQISYRAYSTTGGFPPLPASVQITGQDGDVPLSYTISNLTAADVGATEAIVTYPAQAAASTGGQPATIQDGSQEGNVVQLGIPSVSTAALGIASISVLRPQTVDDLGNIGVDTSNVLAATDAEWRVDNALQKVGSARSTIGAQIVSLKEDANQAQIASTSLTASASSIRDLDVAAATTQFTRLTIASQLQQQVLGGVERMSTMIYQLLAANFP
jgi:flagellin